MKHKTSELEGALLDAAVALADGRVPEIVPYRVSGGYGITFVRDEPVCTVGTEHFDPSTRWQDAGPIIEREHIGAAWDDSGGSREHWTANIPGGPSATGPTHLIAAMRAFVASKMGEEVELP